jgi:hypothetical protein
MEEMTGIENSGRKTRKKTHLEDWENERTVLRRVFKETECKEVDTKVGRQWAVVNTVMDLRAP